MSISRNVSATEEERVRNTLNKKHSNSAQEKYNLEDNISSSWHEFRILFVGNILFYDIVELLFGGQITTFMLLKMCIRFRLCFVKGDLVNIVLLFVFVEEIVNWLAHTETKKKLPIQCRYAIARDCPIVPSNLFHFTGFIFDNPRAQKVLILHIQHTTAAATASSEWPTKISKIFTNYFMNGECSSNVCYYLSWRVYRLSEPIHFWFAEALTHKNEKSYKNNPNQHLCKRILSKIIIPIIAQWVDATGLGIVYTHTYISHVYTLRGILPK